MQIDLDHVAIATRDVTELLTFLVGELGAHVLFGGPNFGFRAMQVQAGEMRIELLEPHNVELNDFLERFLARSGEGPHHLTFKTDDIERELERATQAGYTPTGVNIDNPMWREAFLHPGQAGGTVVQLAQSSFDPLEWRSQLEEMTKDNPERGMAAWWPAPPEAAAEGAGLRRVVVTTDEMTKAIGLYEDLLGGERQGWGEGWLELGWPGGGHVRLEHAAGRQAGIDRLEWTRMPGSDERSVAGARFVYAPD